MRNRLWNSFKIAFSMYSRIPMPQSEWTEENMSYAMCFFPLIGGVIGFVTWVVYQSKLYLELNHSGFSDLFWTILLVLIPVVITGGIHLDGFLDTQDALSSYQPKERRLEILKDPHTGAFAVISCVVYFLAYVGIYSSVTADSIRVIAWGFLLSRTLSGLAVVTFPQARKSGEGTVATFSERATTQVTKGVLMVYLIILCVVMVMTGKYAGMAVILVAGSMFGYYHHMAVSRFGGITGDLAGYFLQMCELLIAASAVICDGIGMMI